MSEIPSPAGALNLIGGAVCLDFTNTVGGRLDAVQDDKLRDYTDLVAWSQHAGIVTEQQARQLLKEAARRPAEAKRVLEQAIQLREALYRIFSARIADRPPRGEDLNLLNETLANALGHSRLVSQGEGFAWSWAKSEDALDLMLWPIARSAAELLTSSELAQASVCANDTCGWLFVDTSRNHSRRWCDMNDCGNRAKARRHYARVRAQQAPEHPRHRNPRGSG